MATIYTKGSTPEKTLILAPREGLLRQFDLGNDWTEIRLGMYMSFVTAGDDNTSAVLESLAVATVADRITFGIKDSGSALPGVATSRFLGVATPDGTNSFMDTAVQMMGANAQISACGFTDTTKVINAGTVTVPYHNNSARPTAGATGYNSFFGMKIVLANRGTATQTAAISGAWSDAAPSVTSVYGVSTLGSDIQNGTYVAMGAALAWNNGVTPYDIPTCFWFRMPFFNNRARISAMRITRFA
jgi:hypothetical protein